MGRPADSLALSIPEAAEALRMSARTVKRRIADGTIPTVRIGGRVLVPRKALERLVNGDSTE